MITKYPLLIVAAALLSKTCTSTNYVSNLTLNYNQSDNKNAHNAFNTPCTPKILSTAPEPEQGAKYVAAATDGARLLSKLHTSAKILHQHANITREAGFARTIFNQHMKVFAIAIRSKEYPNLFAYRKRDRLLIHKNRTKETDVLWRVLDDVYNKIEAPIGGNWTHPFRDCYFNPGNWYQGYFAVNTKGVSVAIFIPIVLNQCVVELAEVFDGRHQCDDETTDCVQTSHYGTTRGGYECRCKDRYYYPNFNGTYRAFLGSDVENGLIIPRCLQCPEICDRCNSQGLCLAYPNFLLRTIILCVELVCITAVVVVAVIIFKQRKSKPIAYGMWTILEMILLGMFLLYATMIVHFFEPSIERCLIEPWLREIGFIICYGAVTLKLWRHLNDFRTRKAHRWVVKDTDLLKYLLIMTIGVSAYMAAFSATALNFVQEHYSLISDMKSADGLHFKLCKPLWWDYVTQAGEVLVLLLALHLSYASRNAQTQYQERQFLFTTIVIELVISMCFYILRPFYFLEIHPDLEFLAYFIRVQLTVTVNLLLLFAPKLWYQHRQSRSLAQEYSCRLPVDAFKSQETSCNAHGALVSNNSDVDIGEISLTDMNPEDIRAELKRLYTQLEILRNKTLRANNPHISKRRGGRKTGHRRFSLQKKGSREKALHGKYQKSHKHHSVEQELTEGDVSRTPEDSICSGEGPSAIYNDLASTYSELIGTPNSAKCKPQPSSYSQ